MKERINNQIRVRELRVIGIDGENLGVLSFEEALKIAVSNGLDLIEVSPEARPPVAKIADYGKYAYEQAKKAKKMKAGAHITETKSVQVKIATGEHDLEMKARQASKWLSEGHRIKAELFLAGRAKGMPDEFLRERMDRFLNLITVAYKISEPYKKGPKGPIITIEKVK
ncbi:translation initiation factor IF-3 [Candidatus Nomurabacteria bacterium RIFCSPHIGHO2_02_FULL_33_12]|uniref:Translation initiation factor IF-3 n=1 Tax=Candidatus Nomurabacteria bacterium RIFCSPLOWO2_01_FULL_33_17 TaxID=1801764 RepID=A0A1F6WPN4_9BACT|nr:MAG: translation initiation factor IF-3 [Candidatus Nomurabacteria bacterium RIFCSPHIGHO2_02_FULL_33_12]OGI83843.1 MAG: translation initiation factor IF-3 [Candidatus Nomurabacteria bacterium RIFCSPLOWO2_01_FULL_33_17]